MVGIPINTQSAQKALPDIQFKSRILGQLEENQRKQQQIRIQNQINLPSIVVTQPKPISSSTALSSSFHEPNHQIQQIAGIKRGREEEEEKKEEEVAEILTSSDENGNLKINELEDEDSDPVPEVLMLGYYEKVGEM